MAGKAAGASGETELDMRHVPDGGRAVFRAFSSEVETGSRQEKRVKKRI
jgi:hypothetical protein